MSKTTINFESLIVSQSNPVRRIDYTSDIKRFNRNKKLSNIKNRIKYNLKEPKQHESKDKKRNSPMKFIIRDRRRFARKLYGEMVPTKKMEWDEYLNKIMEE
ncbi:MAG TPA: hypothetical protein PLC53_03590 [Bacilli bacterium]|nr:hypothetical protein [Bacilli bacterium]